MLSLTMSWRWSWRWSKILLIVHAATCSTVMATRLLNNVVRELELYELFTTFLPQIYVQDVFNRCACIAGGANLRNIEICRKQQVEKRMLLKESKTQKTKD